MNKIGIYIHVPFCNGKCNYCDFVSGVYSDEIKAEYFDKLSAEINDFDFSDYMIDSVYFGGGTPSSVSAEKIADILDLLHKKSAFVDDPEITVECNPESLSSEKCAVYKSSGVNRLSIGLQTATDSLLRKIGRLHLVQDFITVLDQAEKYFDNISADLMLGIPEQTPVDVKRAVNLLAGRNLKHISAYSLKVEEGTPLAASGFTPDEDYSADLYEIVSQMLFDYGYKRYEVSNFAFGGYECRHNLRYWKRGEYKGFGLAAHSFVKNERLANTADFTEYFSGTRQVFSQYIDPKGKDAADETLMLALRTSNGLDLKEYKSSFGIDLIEEKAEQIELLKDFVEISNGRLRLKDSGFYVMNDIIVRLTV